ncbi:MAG: RNA polymerase sigma factor [Deltaproteobacteria bacterium]|nr:RNA polymerase sigma factor [Deltaproteobacteria bacterium]
MEKRVPPPIPRRGPQGLARRVGPPPVPTAAGRAALEPERLEAEITQVSREADELVEGARRGDPRAFEALVKRYRHRIFALALHMTGSPSDADDITQDAFVRAFRNMERFEGRSEFFTWLYRIALNRALNVRRDQARRRTADLDDPRVVVAIAVDSGGDPGRALELRETYVCLVKAFDRLSPLLRTTVALTMMQGLSYPEAAVVLETTEGTVAWRIHEARKQMREAIHAYFAEKGIPAAVTPRKDPTPLPVQKAAIQRKVAAAHASSESPSLEMALALLAPTV